MRLIREKKKKFDKGRREFKQKSKNSIKPKPKVFFSYCKLPRTSILISRVNSRMWKLRNSCLCVQSTDTWVSLNCQEMRPLQSEGREVTLFFSWAQKLDFPGPMWPGGRCVSLGPWKRSHFWPLILSSTLSSPFFVLKSRLWRKQGDYYMSLEPLNGRSRAWVTWKVLDKPFVAWLCISTRFYVIIQSLFWNYLLQHLSLTCPD